MEALNLNWFDAVALAIIVISGVMAFARGLLREVFSIVAFILAALAAIYLRGVILPFVSGIFSPQLVAELGAAGILFLGVFIGVTILTSLLAKAVHQSTEIGMLDRGAGLLFGVARGVLILALFVLLMRHITGAPQAPMPTFLTQARLYPILEQAAITLEAVIPRARDSIMKRTAGESAPAEPAPAGTPAAPAAPAPAR
jgi:membrane protein required for colicin V production